MTHQPSSDGYDAVVVGASAAGSAAATFLARRGARVLLVDRQPDPHAFKRICTHFIQAGALPAIQRLGLAEPLERAGAVRNAVDAWCRWGWIRPRPGADYELPAYGYNLRRQVLDPLVRELATRTGGVTYKPGLTATGLLGSGGLIGGVRLADRGGAERRVHARLVVGADGRGSTVAKLARVPTIRHPNHRFAYFAQYVGVQLEGAPTKIWILDPDAAGAFRNEDGITVLSCMLSKDKAALFKDDAEASLERFFARLPGGPRLDDAARVSPLLGRLDMTCLTRLPSRPGLALVGDAALTPDPLQGIGLGWAFESAELLADTVGEALVAGRDLTGPLRAYARRHAVRFGGHHLLSNLTAQARPFNPIERLMFSAAARDEEMALHAYGFLSRSIPVREFLAPRHLARALAVNLGATLAHRSGSGLQAPGTDDHAGSRPRVSAAAG